MDRIARAVNTIKYLDLFVQDDSDTDNADILLALANALKKNEETNGYKCTYNYNSHRSSPKI